MTHLDTELPKLRKHLIEMMDLVKSQVGKGYDAIKTFDNDLAYDIIANEKRVNALELKIDRDCENNLALYNPVAIDLRFIMASYNINSTLERIGDNAESIARYILHFDSPFSEDIKARLRFEQMFELVMAMLDDVIEAYKNEDTRLARKIFKRDLVINEIHALSPEIIEQLIIENPDKIKQLLYIFSVIKKLERIGDLAKNIAEELIFYIEAKVLKHKNKDSEKKIKKDPL
ncbi:MAG: phosphate signaling complex protein PhoU [Bacteroidales bacterium]|nr:phosphate signaling complex protein PhoU [Bacteroidales bacterium]